MGDFVKEWGILITLLIIAVPMLSYQVFGSIRYIPSYRRIKKVDDLLENAQKERNAGRKLSEEKINEFKKALENLIKRRS